jgi:hypothetical protein
MAVDIMETRGRRTARTPSRSYAWIRGYGDSSLADERQESKIVVCDVLWEPDGESE